MKAIITGGQLFNKGAQSMTYITVSELRERFGENTEIVMWSQADFKRSVQEKEKYKFAIEPVFGEREIWYLAGGFYKILSKIKGVDTKQVEKLKSILTETDFMIDISGYAMASVWKFHHPFKVLALISACKNCNCKYFVMPQSIGPFNYKGIEKILFNLAAKKSFKDAEVIYAREKDGLKSLAKYKLKNVKKAYDLVLSNKGVKKEYIFNEIPAVNVPEIKASSVGIIPNVKTFKYGNKESIMDCYKNIVGKLLENNKNVYLFTHSSEDMEICRNIKALFSESCSVNIIEDELSCLDYDEVVAKFDFLIASRYHSIVHAYRKSVPAIVLGWAVKYHELLGLFGQEAYIFDVRNMSDNNKVIFALEKMIGEYKTESEKIRNGLRVVQQENTFDILGKKYDDNYPDKSVQKVSDINLCSACGVCVGVCPKNAVSLEKRDGTYVSVVNENCINCGICSDVCTALDVDVSALYKKSWQDVADDKLLGNVQKCYTISIKDKKILKNSTSGGFISGTVKYLLENNIYDCAFLVKGYNYDHLLKTERVTQFEPETAKSRYLSVSSENLVKEMLGKKDEKIIICATGCALEAIINVIDKFKLNRENYLLLGLFCDNVQSYRVMDYFSSLRKKKIDKLYFRDKTTASWPGNVRIDYTDGKSLYHPASVRMAAKRYYKLKRCFVCFDKLNVLADISVGDNYTKENASANGSNSIIVRTAKGSEVFDRVKNLFDVYETTISKISFSQFMDKRKENLLNASVVSEKYGVAVYSDMETEITQADKEKYISYISDTNKTLKEIKKEIKIKRNKKLVTRIKRKLGIK